MINTVLAKTGKLVSQKFREFFWPTVLAPAAWLLVRYLGLTGVWLAFILAELAGFAVLYIYIARVKARRSLPDFFLIPDKPRHILYDVSVSATKENAVALSKGAIAALESSGLAILISASARRERAL